MIETREHSEKCGNRRSRILEFRRRNYCFGKENPMRMLFSIGLIASACVVSSGAGANPPQQDKEPLRLVQTIPLPNVKGRIDHMDVDVKGKRLFVAGLENGTLEVVDLKAGKLTRSIPGFKAPQGIAYLPSLNKVFVASNDDGMVRVFRGDTLDLLGSIHLDLGANRVAYDARAGLLYVGYGGRAASKENGAVGIIDARSEKHIADIQVGPRAAEILMDKSGQTLFVFDSIASKIQVIDKGKRQMRSTWPVSSERPGDGALDESSHRLLIGTRNPPEMIVMDSTSGKEIAKLPTVEGMDGVYFDAAHKRVYISGRS